MKMWQNTIWTHLRCWRQEHTAPGQWRPREFSPWITNKTKQKIKTFAALVGFSAPSHCLGSANPVVRFIDHTRQQLTNRINLWLFVRLRRARAGSHAQTYTHWSRAHTQTHTRKERDPQVYFFFFSFLRHTEEMCCSLTVTLPCHSINLVIIFI